MRRIAMHLVYFSILRCRGLVVLIWVLIRLLVRRSWGSRCRHRRRYGMHLGLWVQFLFLRAVIGGCCACLWCLLLLIEIARLLILPRNHDVRLLCLHMRSRRPNITNWSSRRIEFGNIPFMSNAKPSNQPTYAAKREYGHYDYYRNHSNSNSC